MRSMRLGLRPQLLVMVTLLLGLGLVPLFWTATTISRVSLERAEVRAALTLGRTIAASVADGHLSQSLGNPVMGTTLIRPDGSRSTEGAAPPEPATKIQDSEGFEDHKGGRRIIWSSARGNSGLAYVGVSLEKEPHQTRSFVGLLALYMGLLGLGLLLAIHLAVTSLIVRPLDQLGRSARRVAFGARELEVPNLPARELVSLGQSLRTMTEKLLSDERELRRHLDEINLANQRLEEAQERLIRSERLACVGRLAAGLAHEVGNPIAAMLGLEQLLLDGGLDEAEATDFLRRIQSETERIHRILRDLLDFARPTHGVGDESDEELGDVAVSISETLSLVRPQKAFKQITVETDLDDHLPLVGLARPKLVQVLLNLLLNAADAVSNRRDDGRIGIVARAEASVVVISITDNGPGVGQSVRKHLFEPFVTTKEVGAGSGLGLAVCRGLVESVGGTIQLDATYAQGARFVVELPRAAHLGGGP
jgi:two-component system, NtrC family, sensor kinase